MDSLNNALTGIKHIQDSQVIAGMKIVQEQFYKDNNVELNTKLTDPVLIKQLQGIWADYIIKVGGEINGTTRD